MLPFNNKTPQSEGGIDLNSIHRYNWRNYMNMENEHINDLWDDMDRLNELYEELGWDHTDYIQFQIEGSHITIRNKSREGR